MQPWWPCTNWVFSYQRNPRKHTKWKVNECCRPYSLFLKTLEYWKCATLCKAVTQFQIVIVPPDYKMTDVNTALITLLLLSDEWGSIGAVLSLNSKGWKHWGKVLLDFVSCVIWKLCCTASIPSSPLILIFAGSDSPLDPFTQSERATLLSKLTCFRTLVSYLAFWSFSYRLFWRRWGSECALCFLSNCFVLPG